MLIMNICKFLNRVQITKDGKSYTCPTKEIHGELFFKFLGEWHKVNDYLYKNK